MTTTAWVLACCTVVLLPGGASTNTQCTGTHAQHIHMQHTSTHLHCPILSVYTPLICQHNSTHLMPQMYSRRSKLFWMSGSWKKGTLGAVRGTSTLTCTGSNTHTGHHSTDRMLLSFYIICSTAQNLPESSSAKLGCPTESCAGQQGVWTAQPPPGTCRSAPISSSVRSLLSTS
jgi:hypothetical protein